MAQSDPLNGKLVVLTGGSGFLGKYVAQALLERGARVRIASRHPEKALNLKPLANLGQIQFAHCDVLSEESVEANMQGTYAVVNLVGAFDGDLIELMGNASGRVARLAKAAGAQAFVHMSAIGASPDEDATEYARAKALGEKLVMEAFPRATLLRPSVIFGRDDNFLNMFAGLIQSLPVLPVFGPEAKLQLVFADDVAEATARALSSPAKYGGKLYELGGPEQLSMMEIHQRIAAAEQRTPILVPMPDFASAIFAALPLTPMDRDQWTMLKAGNVVSENAAGFAKLGIEPKPVSLYLDRWMTSYRKHGRFSIPSKA